jgi:hypothetical protein
MIPQTENRAAWYTLGENRENLFIEKYGKKLELIINPSKEIYKTAPDLYSLKEFQSAELKVQFAPFFKSQTLFNIEPQFAWTFNQNDLLDYAITKDDKFPIYIWVNYAEDIENYGIVVKKFEAVYMTRIFYLKQLVEKACLWDYIRRKNTSGNSKESYAFDLRTQHFKRLV